ncbi:hypothetical protein BDV96DRAFT_594155 [Lophiotrema nucula]|uniref:Uncharacterized protein n=1 Tax=Lophiotrema nucula TaxID=690887 RepID=A0A6A5ZSN2_9PLEO|nr:hypothetical protein BDV96DRAFT_594155 [Lophiotrema nucula]
MNYTSAKALAARGKGPSVQEPDAYPSPASTLADANNISSDPVSLEEPSEDEAVEDDLTARIRASISYTATCFRTNQTPTVYSDFTVSITNPPSTALTLLRTAEGTFATLITESLTHARYSVPVAPAQRATPFNYAVLSPQWWRKKSKAQIRAGPDADRNKLRQAERYLETRKTNERRGPRSKWFDAERHNLLIGLRAQNVSAEEIAELEGRLEGTGDAEGVNTMAEDSDYQGEG